MVNDAVYEQKHLLKCMFTKAFLSKTEFEAANIIDVLTWDIILLKTKHSNTLEMFEKLDDSS